jgi:hypothetical protein
MVLLLLLLRLNVALESLELSLLLSLAVIVKGCVRRLTTFLLNWWGKYSMLILGLVCSG